MTNRPHVPGPSAAIEDAIASLGSLAALARTLDVTPAAISKWSKLGRVPAERVLAVERATQGRVSRHELRPDLYPRRLVRPH